MSLSNSDVAEKYAKGEIKGQSKNMFIEDDTIYSYGHHFPIAKRIYINDERYYLFNLNSYSSSTIKHKSYVKRAIGYDNLIYVIGCEYTEKAIKRTIVYNTKELNRLYLYNPKLASTRLGKEIKIRELTDQNKLLILILKEAEKVN